MRSLKPIGREENIWVIYAEINNYPFDYDIYTLTILKGKFGP